MGSWTDVLNTVTVMQSTCTRWKGWVEMIRTINRVQTGSGLIMRLTLSVFLRGEGRFVVNDKGPHFIRSAKYGIQIPRFGKD